MLNAAARAPLVPGVDYTVDELGRWVFTAQHLKLRGYCCFNACRNCPWGQAGRTRAEVFADLQHKLDGVEQRLQDSGFDIEIAGYRMGLLHVRPPPGACAPDLAALECEVQEIAKEHLTIIGIAWT